MTGKKKNEDIIAFFFTNPKMTSVFGHFDIEADGPTPATSNMINIGIVFTDESGKTLSEICVDLQPRIGYPGDPDTLKWWAHPDRIGEYQRIIAEGKNPIHAMESINTVILDVLAKTNATKIVWVARPAAYDWMFLKCYWDIYRLHNPNAHDIGFSATCLSSIREVWKMFSGLKRNEIDEYFKQWTKTLIMTHNGLDDARYQARIYHGIMDEMKEYASKVTNKV